MLPRHTLFFLSLMIVFHCLSPACQYAITCAPCAMRCDYGALALVLLYEDIITLFAMPLSP